MEANLFNNAGDTKLRNSAIITNCFFWSNLSLSSEFWGLKDCSDVRKDARPRRELLNIYMKDGDSTFMANCPITEVIYCF